VDDVENKLSKIIMSATDEDAVEIQDEKKHRLSCINQYLRKQYIIKIFATIFFMMIMALGVIFGINIKLKDHSGSSYNCVGSNCTTLSTTTGNVHFISLIFEEIVMLVQIVREH
jgi:hypothetical protein